MERRNIAGNRRATKDGDDDSDDSDDSDDYILSGSEDDTDDTYDDGTSTRDTESKSSKQRSESPDSRHTWTSSEASISLPPGGAQRAATAKAAAGISKVIEKENEGSGDEEDEVYVGPSTGDFGATQAAPSAPAAEAKTVTLTNLVPREKKKERAEFAAAKTVTLTNIVPREKRKERAEFAAATQAAQAALATPATLVTPVTLTNIVPREKRKEQAGSAAATPAGSLAELVPIAENYIARMKAERERVRVAGATHASSRVDAVQRSMSHLDVAPSVALRGPNTTPAATSIAWGGGDDDDDDAAAVAAAWDDDNGAAAENAMYAKTTASLISRAREGRKRDVDGILPSPGGWGVAHFAASHGSGVGGDGTREKQQRRAMEVGRSRVDSEAEKTRACVATTLRRPYADRDETRRELYANEERKKRGVDALSVGRRSDGVRGFSPGGRRQAHPGAPPSVAAPRGSVAAREVEPCILATSDNEDGERGVKRASYAKATGVILSDFSVGVGLELQREKFRPPFAFECGLLGSLGPDASTIKPLMPGDISGSDHYQLARYVEARTTFFGCGPPIEARPDLMEESTCIQTEQSRAVVALGFMNAIQRRVALQHAEQARKIKGGETADTEYVFKDRIERLAPALIQDENACVKTPNTRYYTHLAHLTSHSDARHATLITSLPSYAIDPTGVWLRPIERDSPYGQTSGRNLGPGIEYTPLSKHVTCTVSPMSRKLRNGEVEVYSATPIREMKLVVKGVHRIRLHYTKDTDVPPGHEVAHYQTSREVYEFVTSVQDCEEAYRYSLEVRHNGDVVTSGFEFGDGPVMRVVADLKPPEDVREHPVYELSVGAHIWLAVGTTVYLEGMDELRVIR